MSDDVDADQERIETLALSCLEAFEQEGDIAIERACAGNADDAAAVLALLRSLSQFGLLGAAPTADGLQPGARIGDFRLLQRLGGGGMGVVFLAEQLSLRRKVALKLLRPGLLDSARSRARFRREVEAISALDHSGICTVYEAGEVEDRPYLAMRHIAGETLALRVQRARDEGRGAGSSSGGTAEALLLVEKIARALHHAHERGVVHRDVKPGNVIVTDAGEPVLLDFGLAIAAGSDSALTLSGDVLGTPAYMAPEQVRGDQGAVDRRTDVYALGVLLYECLVSRPPFAGKTRDDLYRQILTEPPPDPRPQVRSIGAELWIVLQKALEKEPRRRFLTTLEFAEELRRICLHEPIRTRRPGVAVRGMRWCQRNRAAAAVLVTAVLGLAVALWLVTLRGSDLRRSEAKAFALAASEVGAEPILAFKLAREAVRRDPSPFNVGRLQEAMGNVYEVAELPVGTEPYRAEYSPDGTRLLVSYPKGVSLFTAEGVPVAVLPAASVGGPASFGPASTQAIAVAEEGVMKILDLDGNEVRRWQHGAAIWIVRWSPDGGRILVVDVECRACLYAPDGSDRVELVAPGLDRAHAQVPHSRLPFDAAWDPSGRYVVTADGWAFFREIGSQKAIDSRVWIWRRDGFFMRSLAGPTREIYRLACSGDRVAAGGHDGTAWLWNALDGTVLCRHPFGADAVYGVALDATGTGAAFTTQKGTVLLVDRDGKVQQTFRPGGTVMSAAFTPDGAHVVTASWAKNVDVWDRNAPAEPVLRLRGHRNGLLHVACAPDGTSLASTSWDRTARIWRLTPIGVRQIAGHRGGAVHVVATPDEATLVAASNEGDLIRSDRAGVEHGRIDGQGLLPHCFRIGSDRHSLIAGWPDGRFVLWNLRSDGPPTERSFPSDLVRDALQLDDGRLIVVAGAAVYRWDAVQGTPPEELIQLPWLGPFSMTRCGADRIAIGGWAGDIVLLNLTNRQLEHRLQGHTNRVMGLDCSPDGRFLLSAGHDNMARLWDLTTGEELRRFTGHQDGVTWAAFVPNGRQVITASRDHTLRLFDLESGRTDLVLTGHRGGVRRGVVTADGLRVVSASDDGTLRWWWLQPDGVIRAADVLAARPNIGPLSDADLARVPWLAPR